MELVDKAVSAIIRPPRIEYDHKALPLVLDTGDDDSGMFMRHPLVVENNRGQKIVCSLYHSTNVHPMSGGPCVIYLHGNASSQSEGQFLVPNFCPHNCFVFCFDFAGCGASGGEYITLGYHETEDIDFLVGFLNESFNLGPFILWGRSMGAATVLMAKSPLIRGIVSDSPFSSIRDMCTATAVSHGVPRFVAPGIIWVIKQRILTLAHFDIDDVNPIEVVKDNDIPVLIGHAINDSLIPFEQSQNILDAYKCSDKTLMQLPGSHNTRRDENWIRAAVTFSLQKLGIKFTYLEISECRKLQSQESHFSSFDQLINGIRGIAEAQGIPKESSSPKPSPKKEESPPKEKVHRKHSKKKPKNEDTPSKPEEKEQEEKDEKDVEQPSNKTRRLKKSKKHKSKKKSDEVQTDEKA